MHKSDVMASSRILEEELIQTVFDGLSDEDESNNDGNNGRSNVMMSGPCGGKPW